MTQGVIAAGDAVTAEAGAEMLRAGGNAYDAALAALCAATVAEPVLCSLGGGGFLLARTANGQARVFDFFAQTPLRRRPAGELEFYPLTADFGAATQDFHIGRGSIATPGVVAGLFDVHAALGRMPMRDIVAPAIAAARDGVRLSALQGTIFSIIAPIYLATPQSRALFESREKPGHALQAGERFANPAFADCLENLAIEGADLFYKGEIAANIATELASGGQLTRADFEAYETRLRAPLETEALGARILTNPPPSAGGLLIAFALRLLDPARLSRFGTGEHLHHLAHVMLATNKARIDSGLNDGLDDGEAARLLDPDFVARYRRHVLGRPFTARGTTHISVIDAAGNAAALTLSNGEGAACVPAGTGIMLNNMLGEEDINPRGFHAWAPNTRISSMMAPTIATLEGGHAFVLGSGGSNRIRTAILQALVNLLAFGMSPEDAAAAPRIHAERDILYYEDLFAEAPLEALKGEFPEQVAFAEPNIFFGGVHIAGSAARGAPRAGSAARGANKTPGGANMSGGGDPRRGGAVVVV